MSEVPAAIEPKPGPRCVPCPLYAEAPDPGICTRCGRGRSVWAYVPLAALALLFIAVLRFTAFLLGGALFSLQRDHLAAEGLSFWRLEPLADYCNFPINLFEHPLQAAVLSGLLGSSILMPLLVSRLFGRNAGLAFVGLAIVFGSFPWLAAMLIPGVVLFASRYRRLRSVAATALAALMPVALYSFWAVDPNRLYSIGPTAKAVAYFPSLLAAPLALVVGLLLLGWARLMRHRIWTLVPVAAVVFAIPPALFFRFIGLSELEFALLAHHHHPSARFDRIPGRDRAAVVEHLRRLGVSDFEQWWDGADFPSLTPEQVRKVLLPRMKRETEHLCAAFIRDYPDSPLTPDVLFFRARALDVRLHAETEATQSGPIRFDWSEPSEPGVAVWRELVKRFPDHPLALAARLQLAKAAGRRAMEAVEQGDWDRVKTAVAGAQRHLGEILARRPTVGANADAELLTSLGFRRASYRGEIEAAFAEAERYREHLDGKRWPTP